MVSCGVGVRPNPFARNVMPTNRPIRTTPSRTSTWRAFLASGGRKAGTPFETASIPVRATQPEAKARRIRNRVSSLVPAADSVMTPAGAALLTDYVLTVSVSVAAGIAAVTSAVPAFYPYRIELCMLGVLAITVANLRGVRESGRVFAIPTYAFIAAYALMIVWGLVALARSTTEGAPAGVMTELSLIHI